MTAITATTTPQQVTTDWDTIQNLGSVDCWIARTSADCTTTTGVKIASGGGTFSRSNLSEKDNRSQGSVAALWIRSDTSTADVRVFGG